MKEVEKWIKKAEKDLVTARVDLNNKEYEAAAFFSHQAAEKALKALYILKFKRLWLKWNLDLPVDFIPFTPEEFNKLKKEVSIVSEALREGVEI